MVTNKRNAMKKGRERNVDGDEEVRSYTYLTVMYLPPHVTGNSTADLSSG
jgi:hypothetical protein